MKIKIFNKRGGYNINIGDLNLIRRLKNENHEYNLVVEGAFEHSRKVSKKSGEIFEKFAQEISMDWKKSLELNNLTFGCITELILRDRKGILLRRR